jgi:hypothetical protein
MLSDSKTANVGFWRGVFQLGLILAAATFLGTAPAHADTDIFDATHTYNGISGTGTVSVAVDVDQVGGLYLWQYIVTNNSFNPVGGNGFSGFELNLPAFPAD